MTPVCPDSGNWKKGSGLYQFAFLLHKFAGNSVTLCLSLSHSCLDLSLSSGSLDPTARQATPCHSVMSYSTLNSCVHKQTLHLPFETGSSSCVLYLRRRKTVLLAPGARNSAIILLFLYSLLDLLIQFWGFKYHLYAGDS